MLQKEAFFRHVLWWQVTSNVNHCVASYTVSYRANWVILFVYLL